MRRRWAAPLVPLYGAGVAGKNWMYARGLLPVQRLGWPVVSVGSLSAGGAGKTPVAMMLAELLAREGVGVDVLSRGYGRGSGVVEAVDPSGSARRFGDEPMEMARSGLRVFVGANRYEAGVLAEKRSSAQPGSLKAGVHVLDDGFQHRRLARDLEVVLLTAADVEDALLPGGNLREPLGSLGRAEVVLLREEEADALRKVAAECAPSAEIWVVRREIVLPAERPGRMIAFCGVARPEGFFGMLREAGCALAGEVAFSDHHAYGAEDYLRLVEAVLHAGADGLVTTAKDVVKIAPVAMQRLSGVAPVLVARLKVGLVNEEAALRTLRRVVERR